MINVKGTCNHRTPVIFFFKILRGRLLPGAMPPPGTRIRSITVSSRRTHSHISSVEQAPPSFHDNDDKIHVLDTHDKTALVPVYDHLDHLSVISEVDKKIEQNIETPCCGTRHVLAFLAFLGFFNVYCMRANLSVALVRMVNSSLEVNSSVSNSANECPGSERGNSSSSHSVGEFSWDEETQGYVLGAFFYGYIVTQLPGGWLASRFGGKNLLGLGVLGTALLTIITPFAARSSVYLLIAVRVLEGFGEGVTFPAMHAIWGEWAPALERSKLVGFTYAGAQLGTVFSLPVSGLLCDSGLVGGWPLVFYVFGSMGCVWFVVWMLLVHDTPAKHPRISEGERDYIQRSVGHKGHQATPWRSILTSPAVWGTAAGHFANNWGLYTLLTCMPTYMKNILKFDIKENGFLSAVPYAVCWAMQNISGLTADYLRSRGYLSTSKTRKLFNSLGI